MAGGDAGAPVFASTVGRVLERSARRTPDGQALTFGERSWSYVELDRAVGRVAAALPGLGLMPGDRVAAFGKNSDAYLLLYLGCARVGLVHMPVNFNALASELAYLLTRSEPPSLFSQIRVGRVARCARYFPGTSGLSTDGTAGRLAYGPTHSGHEAVPRSRETGAVCLERCQRHARPSREEAIVMPETKAQRSEAARRGAATRKAHELQNTQEQYDLERKQQGHVSEVVDRTSELSEDVLKSLESGSRAAVEAVRKFVDVVDEALPALPHGDRPSRRREIVDAAMDMADRLVKTQYEFLRSVVHSAGTTLSREEDEK